MKLEMESLLTQMMLNCTVRFLFSNVNQYRFFAGTGVLKMAHTFLFTLQWDENLDVGSDTVTLGELFRRLGSFAFTGKFGKVTLFIERPKLSPKDVKKLQAPRLSKESSE